MPINALDAWSQGKQLNDGISPGGIHSNSRKATRSLITDRSQQFRRLALTETVSASLVVKSYVLKNNSENVIGVRF